MICGWGHCLQKKKNHLTKIYVMIMMFRSTICIYMLAVTPLSIHTSAHVEHGGDIILDCFIKGLARREQLLLLLGQFQDQMHLFE